MGSYLGFLAAILAFVLWGFLPVYWKLLSHVPALEILCHRMVWSLGVTLLLVLCFGRWRSFIEAARSKKNLFNCLITAILLAQNWLLYIWAVNAGFIIETSLGYFINPLINVLFGMVFFGERMRFGQWLALSLAFAGVLYLTIYYGKFPWISLVLAISFAGYGLFHKKSGMAAIDGLCLETAIMFCPAAFYLLFLGSGGMSSFTADGLFQALLLVGCGVVTTAPLVLFGYAAKNIALSTLGLLQYLAPSINLLLGVFIYHEPFPIHRLVGFILIWVALILFLLENLRQRYLQKQSQAL